MKVTATTVYEGPNIHAPVPVIHWRIDLEGLEEWPTGRLGAAFVDAVLECLPGLGGHGGSEDAPGGFARAMAENDGVPLGEVMARAAQELQRLGGADVEFAEACPVGGGVCDVLYGYEGREVGIAAGKLAVAVITHLLPSELRPAAAPPPDFDFARARDTFIKLAQSKGMNFNTKYLLQVAASRGIPWSRLGSHSALIRFGYGRFQTRMAHCYTDRTSYISFVISSDKALTNRILGELGLPVPRQRLVADEQEAVRAAEQIGYPVAVKPLRADFGLGVSLNLADADEVHAAFAWARRYGPAIIVESFIQGDDHRMLVVDGELIAVSNRVRAHVVGDGVHTVEELIDEVNRDPRRGTKHLGLLVRLELDEDMERMLAKVGYTRETVPAKGETVYLRITAGPGNGGTAVDVTDRVHPDNRMMAILAAEATGIDVAGVDFITPDIGRSYKDVGGGICEVNTTPALRPHMAAEGNPPDVAGAIIDTLYPPGALSRIPIAALTGGPGATSAASMLAHVLQTAGQTVGLATREGLAIDGDRLADRDFSGAAGARSVLHNPSVDVAVLEISPEGVLRRGLGFDHCDVAAVVAVAGDANPASTIPAEMQTKAIGVVVRAARRAVVLDADDGACRAMADHADGGHVCYVTMDPGHPLVDEHLAAGGRAVVLEKGGNGGTITLCDGDDRIALVDADRIPAPGRGSTDGDVRAAMVAAAMAHALGKTAKEIGEGLGTFAPARQAASVETRTDARNR